MKISDYTPCLFSSLKNYTKEKFFADLMSGIIVGIVALPLSIAFAIGSGVSPEKGLITAIIGGFFVSFLGGSRVQIGGPTGAFIVVVYGIIEQYGVTGLAIVTVLAGLILFLMGLLRMGPIIKFIPYPIVVGFTSGIALTIFTTQIKDLFGFEITKMPADFIPRWALYFKEISSVNVWVTIIGIGSLIMTALMSRYIKKIPGSLIAIFFFSTLVYLIKRYTGIESIDTIGDRFAFQSSLPRPESIPFSLESIRILFPSAFTIAMLGAIESLFSATVADGVTGDKHNSNVELMAQGVANMVVPFFGGIPVVGAMARTMTNINNGGRTPIAGIVHSVLLLFILLFLGSLTQHIPMACLAGILVVVSYNMSQWRTFAMLLKGSRSDAAVLLTTFILTVILDLTVAIEIGLLLSMLLFMKRMSEVSKISIIKNKLDLSKEGEIVHEDETFILPPEVEIYEIEGPFFFGMANKFDACMRTLKDKPKVRIIRMRHVPFIDSTGIHNLEMLYKSSVSEGIRIILSGVNNSVSGDLKNAGFSDLIGEEYICGNINEAFICAEKELEKISKK